MNRRASLVGRMVKMVMRRLVKDDGRNSVVEGDDGCGDDVGE